MILVSFFKEIVDILLELWYNRANMKGGVYI